MPLENFLKVREGREYFDMKSLKEIESGIKSI
jgi:hypothetical protein